eukprot:2015914-Alexandrium_andersonii.AAC.1
MPGSASIRHNPQFALQNMQKSFRRPKLELREPRSGLKLVPDTPEGCVRRRFSHRFRMARKRELGGA